MRSKLQSVRTRCTVISAPWLAPSSFFVSTKVLQHGWLPSQSAPTHDTGRACCIAGGPIKHARFFAGRILRYLRAAKAAGSRPGPWRPCNVQVVVCSHRYYKSRSDFSIDIQRARTHEHKLCMYIPPPNSLPSAWVLNTACGRETRAGVVVGCRVCVCVCAGVAKSRGRCVCEWKRADKNGKIDKLLCPIDNPGGLKLRSPAIDLHQLRNPAIDWHIGTCTLCCFARTHGVEYALFL